MKKRGHHFSWPPDKRSHLIGVILSGIDGREAALWALTGKEGEQGGGRGPHLLNGLCGTNLQGSVCAHLLTGPHH